MRVRNFILAHAASSAEGMYFLHGAGLKAIDARQFPYTHPIIGLYVTLVFERGDPPGEHELAVVLIGGDGRPVDALIQGNLQIPALSGEPGSEVSVFDLVVQKVGLRVPRRDRYWVSLRVAGEELDRVPLTVGVVQ